MAEQTKPTTSEDEKKLAQSGGGGLSTGLQPGGTFPGGGPGAGPDSIGTGGGQTADAPSGNVKKGGR
jgi:hypothetical protein